MIKSEPFGVFCIEFRSHSIDRNNWLTNWLDAKMFYFDLPTKVIKGVSSNIAPSPGSRNCILIALFRDTPTPLAYLSCLLAQYTWHLEIQVPGASTRPLIQATSSHVFYPVKYYSTYLGGAGVGSQLLILIISAIQTDTSVLIIYVIQSTSHLCLRLI